MRAVRTASPEQMRIRERPWLVLLAWVLLYPVPPLPVAPALGYLTAVLLGPPYTTGTDAHGWPQIGEVTPGFVAVTLGLPWLLSSLLVAVGVLVLTRPGHRQDGRRIGTTRE